MKELQRMEGASQHFVELYDVLIDDSLDEGKIQVFFVMEYYQ